MSLLALILTHYRLQRKILSLFLERQGFSNAGASLEHQTAALHCTVARNIFFLFFVFGCVVFVFERCFPCVLPLLSACLMYQSFRWGVTGMALSFRSKELSVFQLPRQV